MTELRTLIEIEDEVNKIGIKDMLENRPAKPNDILLAIKLRQEAIKWVKFIRGNNKEIDRNFKIETIEETTTQATKLILRAETDIIIRWIMHFFNITEKELE